MDSTSPQPPSFFFRADAITPHPAHIDRPGKGVEIPPRARGANGFDLASQFLPPDQVWFYNGRSQTVHLTTLTPHLQAVGHVQCYTVYVMNDDVIYTVPYDAVEAAVHDGRQPGGQGTSFGRSGRGLPHDWERLSFRDTMPSFGPVQTYAEHHAGQSRLRAAPRDSRWPEQLLPGSCRPQSRQRKTKGGLVGHTCLLIALLALTLPPSQVGRVLPLLLGKEWSCLPREQAPAEDYRIAHRGVIVKLWHALDTATTDHAQHAQRIEAWNRSFAWYQEGLFGPMFP